MQISHLVGGDQSVGRGEQSTGERGHGQISGHLVENVSGVDTQTTGGERGRGCTSGQPAASIVGAGRAAGGERGRAGGRPAGIVVRK